MLLNGKKSRLARLAMRCRTEKQEDRLPAPMKPLDVVTDLPKAQIEGIETGLQVIPAEVELEILGEAEILVAAVSSVKESINAELVTANAKRPVVAELMTED